MKSNQEWSARSKYINQLYADTEALTSVTQVEMMGCLQPQSVLTSPSGVTGNHIIGITVNERGRTTNIHNGNTMITNSSSGEVPVEISVGFLSDCGEVWSLNIEYLGGRVFATRHLIAHDKRDDSDFTVMGE